MITELSDRSPVNLFSKLSDSLQSIKNATIFRAPEDHVPFFQEENACPRLINSLSHLGLARFKDDINRDPQATLKKWTDYKISKENMKLSPRDFKRFCWTPEIITDKRFQELFISNSFPITLSSLRGLLYSYHVHFLEMCSNEKFEERLIYLIQDKAVRNKPILAWSKEIAVIVGRDAPIKLARLTYKNLISPEKQLEELALNSTTEFAQKFSSDLILHLAAKFDAVPIHRIKGIIENIFPSPLIGRKEFKEAIGMIILSKNFIDNQEAQDRLIDFLLNNESLGDPRISPQNWAGIDSSAKKRFIQWLSREDINFFFELLLGKGKDIHKRKDFWLQYVHKVTRSRALICKKDLSRHSVRLAEMLEKGRTYGKLKDTTEVSAFVLDFGNIIAVEFSMSGNACYVYDRVTFNKIFYNFWAEEASLKSLKNQDLARDRILHKAEDWQNAAKNTLSRLGVRRES